ncbi:PA14 domain-containing protein [Streptomyces sp. NPDC046909]|uniref:fibronectin type III domain-containing protein n=1 Tax=Streptomyces sp. NPDC046909 TaxID=3155617 RepID=UPI0033F88E22
MNPARRTAAITSTAVVLATAGTLLTVTPASAATTCTSPVFKRQFFANTTFSGTPKKTDCDNAIDQNWGTGAPTSGLPSNNFGVRWSVTRDFGSGGPFSLAASGLDGIRVYVDGVRKISLWKNTSSTVSKTVNVTIPSGKHTLRVDYVNWTGAAKVKFTYTPRTSASVDKVKPLTPTGTSAAYDAATRKAKLTWSKNKEMDLAGYQVHRRLKGSGSWTKVATTTATATSYTDTPPATGETYYYEIRAYDKAGNTSPGTADKPVTTVFAAPQGLTATSSNKANSLTWQAASGVKSYEVYRAFGDTGNFGLLAVVDSPAYADSEVTANVPYTYKVRSLNAAGAASPYSNVVSATVDTVAPLKPEGLTVASADEGGITLTWQKPGADTVKYNVYRGTSPLSGTLIGSSSTTAYRDTGAEAGQLYSYMVTAVDAAGNQSSVSTPVNATRPVGPSSVPRKPSIMNPQIVGDQLSMSFENSGYVPVSSYEVYRSRTTPVDTTVAANHFGGSTGTFTATVAEDERDYYYAVVAVSSYGVRSAPSNSFKPQVVEVSDTPLPTAVSDVIPGDGQVRLIWGTPPNSPGNPAVVAYRVYRSTTPGVTKENAESAVLTQSSDYTDSGLTNGTTYYYAVATVSVYGVESALSAEVSATPAA